MKKYKKMKQFSIIFFVTIVFLFFIEYFFKLDHLRISHKIFDHTFAPNKVFFYQWGGVRYKICTDNNGFRIKCDGNSYKNFDIAKWCLDQCENDEQVQRVGRELVMYQKRGLMSLLLFLRYFVKTMRSHNIVWGVGRGSSVASYVLYLIGVHKIDSIFYDLDVEDFLR